MSQATLVCKLGGLYRSKAPVQLTNVAYGFGCSQTKAHKWKLMAMIHAKQQFIPSLKIIENTYNTHQQL